MFFSFDSTSLIWKRICFLNTWYNHLILTLPHHFRHQKRSIYWLVTICQGTLSDNQYLIFFSQCTAWSFSNSNKLFTFLKDNYPPYDDKRWVIFETKINRNLRCSHGYTNCVRHTDLITWVICQGKISDNQDLFFLNTLLGHSWTVINFFHSWNITICQANKSKSRKKTLEKYITPFPWLIITNLLYCFGEFGISRNTD